MPKKEGILKRFYLGARWPFVICIGIIALVLFLIGLIEVLGYNGTTSLRAVRSDEATWIDFSNLFKSQKGAPFKWDGGSPAIKNQLVTFDKRLIRVLEYLKQPGNSGCVWNGTHQSIGLSVQSDKESDTSKPDDKQTSISTIYRGTGVRITSVDEVKCTIIPKNERCAYKSPTAFDQKSIPLVTSVTASADKAYDNVNCEVQCAVDYYPSAPAGEDAVPPTVSVSQISKLNPGVFRYEEMGSKMRDASVYKGAQIAYEIMRIDDKQCEKADGNQGGDRAIPTTIIFPHWLMKGLGDGWSDFENLAENEFPYDFQKGSPLAGLSYDPLLDRKGLHINF